MSWHTNNIGSVMVLGSAQGSTNVWDATNGVFQDTVKAWGLGTTSVVGMALTSTTAALVGTTVENGPMLEFGGTAWKSDATAASQTQKMYLRCKPSTGAASTTAVLEVLSSNNGGAITQRHQFREDGYYIPGAGVICSNTYFGLSLSVGGVACYGVYQTNAASGAMLMSPSRTIADNNICAYIGFHNAGTATDYFCLSSTGRGTSTWTASLNVYPKHILIPSTTVANAPASPPAGSLMYCSNGDTGNPCLAVGNGSNWLRVALGAAIAAS